MKLPIEEIVALFESGKISRRQFVAALTALSLGRGVRLSATQAGDSAFEATELNHLAIRVTDLDRSQKFYEEQLGMRLIRKLSNARFMACGPHFVALFRGDEPRLDHFSFTIENYDQQNAVKKLEARGLRVELEEDRTYFFDPDGYQLQVTHPQDWPGREPRPKSS